MMSDSPVSPSPQDCRNAVTRGRSRATVSVKNLKWQKEEDELLMRVMSDGERPNYANLAQLFPGKSGQQVAERWDKVLNPALMKGSWTRTEDETIVEFVRKNGTKQWRSLCGLLPGRLGKQCRERWRNHLDPAINHDPWTAEEDAQLAELHKAFGNAWVRIAAVMRNRSDNAVKNRWNANFRKCESCGSTMDGPSSRRKTSTEEENAPSPSSPRQEPVAFFSPFLCGHRIGHARALEVASLEENRLKLLELILD
jgi:hypothetical protein